ncbi:MAG: hypothetical protein M0O96_11685, partial [Desulforhopalus sp.]|nr:hypothetical protein [Desulforhopalus sp.]
WIQVISATRFSVNIFSRISNLRHFPASYSTAELCCLYIFDKVLPDIFFYQIILSLALVFLFVSPGEIAHGFAMSARIRKREFHARLRLPPCQQNLPYNSRYIFSFTQFFLFLSMQL